MREYQDLNHRHEVEDTITLFIIICRIMQFFRVLARPLNCGLFLMPHAKRNQEYL